MATLDQLSDPSQILVKLEEYHNATACASFEPFTGSERSEIGLSAGNVPDERPA